MLEQGTILLPSILVETPCKKDVTSGRFFRLPKCKFNHEGLPETYILPDQKLTCHVVDSKDNVKLSPVAKPSYLDAIYSSESAAIPNAAETETQN